jgi:uncharacterized protein (TIGR03085 family)
MAPSLAQSERQSLCTLFEDRSPLAPTLCEGWTTSDLAAHLYVRESRPLASPGILIPAFAEITERAMDKAKRDLGYAGLIGKLRSGPPYPFRLIDAQMNLMEYFVHFEDVRRAEDGWEPRQNAALDTGLWPMARRGARLMARHLNGAGLELVAPGFGNVIARSGEPRIVVTAGPQELILLLFGRKKAARLKIEGPESAGELLDSTRFGI